MFGKPRSVRKRSSSSSGLIPASSRRNTLRISSSSNATDVFDCSVSIARGEPSSFAEPGEALDALELDAALRALHRQTRPHRADQLPRERRVVGEDVEPGSPSRYENSSW